MRRNSAVRRRAGRWRIAASVPIEIRPYVRAALAADPTGEALLDIGQPDIIGPGIAADRDGVATAVVGANNQQPAHTALAHLGKGDFLWAIDKGAVVEADEIEQLSPADRYPDWKPA
jgi:hypothetical protein